MENILSSTAEKIKNNLGHSLINFILSNKGVIVGSYILQNLYNEKYNNSDIDIQIPFKPFIKKYNLITENQYTTLINDNYKDYIIEDKLLGYFPINDINFCSYNIDYTLEEEKKYIDYRQKKCVKKQFKFLYHNNIYDICFIDCDDIKLYINNGCFGCFSFDKLYFDGNKLHFKGDIKALLTKEGELNTKCIFIDENHIKERIKKVQNRGFKILIRNENSTL